MCFFGGRGDEESFNMTLGAKYEALSPSLILPPANEVWGKVLFLHLYVILFTGGGLCQGGGVSVRVGLC